MAMPKILHMRRGKVSEVGREGRVHYTDAYTDAESFQVTIDINIYDFFHSLGTGGGRSASTTSKSLTH